MIVDARLCVQTTGGTAVVFLGLHPHGAKAAVAEVVVALCRERQYATGLHLFLCSAGPCV